MLLLDQQYKEHAERAEKELDKQWRKKYKELAAVFAEAASTKDGHVQFC